MKYLTTLLFTLTFTFTFAQITLFKDINTSDDGSFPANFTEINGITFFSVKTLDGYRLWKTNETEVGTVQVSEQSLYINSSYIETPDFYVFNNELYYFVQIINGSFNRQLWKTDGTNKSLVLDNSPSTQLYFFNNQIYYIITGGLYKIENGLSVQIKNLQGSFELLKHKPVIFNNQLLFFQYTQSPSNQILQVWKSDGTENGTNIIQTVDSLITDSYSGYNNYANQTISINNQAYFVIKRFIVSPDNTSFKTLTELWKSDGTTTELVKEIYNYPNYSDEAKAQNLANFNGKLIFIFKNQEFWQSDGTKTGTTIIKTFPYIGYEYYNKKWGILNNKCYFSANENSTTDAELWQSDGTTAGTSQFKDLNSTASSYPNYFVKINNKLFFRANNDELWQSDGTLSGTNFVQAIAKTANSASSRVTPEFIYTSSNHLLYSYFDAQHDFELWKTDGTSQHTGLLKNIVSSNKGSLGSDKKIKVGNIWYFNGSDSRGAELWKTDGTPEGTVLVKEINTGPFDAIIKEIVAVGTTIYFIAFFPNDNTLRLFKSDGTESGTIEIPLNSNSPYFGVNPNSLTATTDKVYFIGYHVSTGNILWVSDGTEAGTHPVIRGYNGVPRNLIGVGNKLFFTSHGLWVSDGTNDGTIKICEYEYINKPLDPICLIELNGKLYFFSNYYDEQYNYKQALFESDGTCVGTKIVRDFDYYTDKLTDSYLLFIEKSNEKLYFRAGYNTNYGSQSFNLWTSDGTLAGTYKLKTVPFTGSINLKFCNVGSQFYLFFSTMQLGTDVVAWTSDGTVAGTNQFFQKQNSSSAPYYVPFQNKLFLSIYDSNYGQELWKANAANNGISLVGEVREGTPNSGISNFMNFDDKLLFWANDDTHGSELWQYQTCVNNQNISTQSGSWDSPNTWSCGRVPTAADKVIIKNSHIVSIPDNYQAFSNLLITEMGAVLTIPKSAVITIAPQ